MGFPPQLFLIGAQKSGTTALATLLGQHPRICLATPKEPDFFSRHFGHGAEWYLQRFTEPDAAWLLDASTSYSNAPLDSRAPAGDADPLRGVPQRIATFCGTSPRFVYIMRDPVERTYASYWHAVRAGHERRPLDLALRETSYYLDGSDYAGQLRLYFQQFPRQQFLLLFFEHFRDDPLSAARRCFDFLELNRNVALDAGKGQNRSFVYAGPLEALNVRLAGSGGVTPLMKKLSGGAPAPLKRLAARLLIRPVPAMSTGQRRLLEQQCQAGIAALSDLIGELPASWPNADRRPPRP